MAHRRSSASSTWPLLRSALLATTSNAQSRISTGCHFGLVAQGEVVRRAVLVDEALHRAGPERALRRAHGLGHEAPAEALGEHVGRDLAPEEAAREVPQRALALRRLVDGQQLLAAEPARHEQGGVGAPGDAAVDLHVTFGEDALDVGVGHLRSRRPVAGARWCAGSRGPAGSSGSEHSGHGGRPASTSRVAWMAKAAACSRVSATRSTWPLSRPRPPPRPRRRRRPPRAPR